ncbi:MAG TPA: SRPBCC domain-containing protein [Candidatus Limnocylindrales bacterium]|nr:SRPBCC domain-containing protein [Candidatus Limnocylindrales bacterium]
MKLEGSIAVAAAPERVWAVMVDPVSLASCVPGVRSVRQIDDRTFEGSITAAVGPIEGDFSFTAVLTETEFPDRLSVAVDGTDSVTKSRLHADVHASVVETAPGATDLRYRAEITVKGRMAILGEMVLRATAGVIIGNVTRCLRARLEREANTAAETEADPTDPTDPTDPADPAPAEPAPAEPAVSA